MGGIEYRKVVETVADDFQENPINYVTERDFQVAMVEKLRAMLSPASATLTTTVLDGTSDTSFKRAYWQQIQRQMSTQGQIDRVHTELSVQKNERLDVAVFQPELSHPIQWVSGGSKRFDERDLEFVCELKFVKNKTSFPTTSGHPVRELAANPSSAPRLCESVSSDTSILDISENGIEKDIKELNRLSDVPTRIMLLVSNNNYLYQNPTPAEKDDYRFGELYHRLGKAARRWMAKTASEGVDILYVHPRGSLWLTDSDR